MRLTGVRGVVFDLDDTLCSERAYAFSGFEAVGAWVRARFECPFDPAIRLRELFDTEHRPRVFNRLLAELGRDDAEAHVPEMVACYRGHTPRLSLYPDGERAIRRWSGQFRLGLISDGWADVQRRKVEALGLRTWLNPILLTDEWGREFWKPHPRAFETVEQAWGFSGRECVYLADNPAKDFVAPRQRGWQTVRVCREKGIYGRSECAPGGHADAQVETFDQVELTFVER